MFGTAQVHLLSIELRIHLFFRLYNEGKKVCHIFYRDFTSEILASTRIRTHYLLTFFLSGSGPFWLAQSGPTGYYYGDLAVAAIASNQTQRLCIQ